MSFCRHVRIGIPIVRNISFNEIAGDEYPQSWANEWICYEGTIGLHIAGMHKRRSPCRSKTDFKRRTSKSLRGEACKRPTRTNLGPVFTGSEGIIQGVWSDMYGVWTCPKSLLGSFVGDSLLVHGKVGIS